jgi:Enoyl-(Acyl carrier protein) reductase
MFFLIGIIRASLDTGQPWPGHQRSLHPPYWGILTRSIARFLRKYQAFRRQLLCGTISCEVADINLTGSFTVAREAGKLMRAHGGGAIVNIASTQVMACKLAPQNIRVNAIAPGLVETPPVQAMQTDRMRSEWLSEVPQRRYASPDEIAGAALFLMDDSNASFVTGHILNVDGGLPVRA